ncbi:ABC transporter ATP-binding protein [Natronomonas sp. EA1]|uniref:ABC transporter ATP-binding protein n=1 Tax=Natronomonas sp. EA1 TaxID=3421655 RepID=UPI003EBD16AB
MIALDDVCVRLGGEQILEAVSLDVAEGEFVALVGPNGAGKTTLLRTINGVVTPDAGRVSVAGEPVHGRSARDISRRVATVQQSTEVRFEFTVRQLVEMGRTPHRGRFGRDPAGHDAVDEALDRTDTAQFADRAVGTLSGGERQRVLLARALAQDTPALLLDEPTASLDINHQVATLQRVRELADRTIVAAIHDLDLAARFCDTVAVLGGGTLHAVGPPAAVFEPDLLERVFDTPVVVREDPLTGTPTVTALSEPLELAKRS